jgi:hypothetical protein
MFSRNSIISENVKISRNYMFEMSKSKEIEKGRQKTKIGGNSTNSCFLPIRHCRASIQ